MSNQDLTKNNQDLTKNNQGDLISKEALKTYARKVLCTGSPTNTLLIRMFDEIIDNVSTIEPFESDYAGAERFKARQRGYEAGYHYGMEIGKTLNPKIKQGEWILNNDENPECPFCHHSFTYWGNFCGNCGAYLKGGAENGKT